jgi:hypothetical protein
MAKIRIPSKDELFKIKEYLRYEPKTGKFFWQKKISSHIKVESSAGTINKKGYIQIQMDLRCYRAHRIAWFLYHGSWPKQDIDHINGIPWDNRIENLRQVTRSKNQQNKKVHLKGRLVGTFKRESGRWQAIAPKNFLDHKSRKQIALGHFDTMEQAAQAVINFCIKKGK